MDRIIIGVDISKKKFDAAYQTINQQWQQGVFENNIEGFKTFLKWIQASKIENLHAVMEATGRYGEELANFLYMSGCNVSLVNPAQIKYYSRSLLKRAKTDKIDSRLIAEFAQRYKIELWKPLSSSWQALKDQTRCLEAFKRDATQISNRLEQARDSMVIKMLRERLTYIEKQIDALSSAIHRLVKNDAIFANMVDLLVTIPGIGRTTAYSLLGELPDLSTFKCAKQLAAYAGLNPSIRISGTSVKGRSSISKIGNSMLRKILFFPAMTLMRPSSILKPFIQNLRNKGKKGKVIVGAVMRKLLHIIFGVLKKQVAFHASI